MSNQLPNSPITRLPDSRWLLLVIVAIPVLAYSNSFRTGFALDNKALILQDERVHAATRENVDLILTHTYWWPIGESGLYRPVTTLSYLFNYAVLGNEDRPAGYHAFNLLLHIANVILVFTIAFRIADLGMRNADWIARDPKSQSAIRNPQSALQAALFISAVWAVHPLSTEAVTNIVGRADLLAALAVLSGLLMYGKSTETTGTRRIPWLAALGVTTTIGVFAKESAVVIAGVIALYAVAFNSPLTLSLSKGERHAREGRGEPRADRKARPSTRSGRAEAKPLPAATLALVLPLLLLWYQRSIVLGAAPPPEFPFVDNPIAGAGFWSGRLTALVVAGRYLWLTVWPVTLSADYSYAQIPLATGRPVEWAAAALAVAAIALAVALWRRHGAAFFYAAFAIVTFLPASNLFFATGTIMAERVMYLPSAGIIGLVVLALDRAARRLRTPAVPAAVVTVIVVLFALRTWQRNRDWTSEVTLWSAAVKASPRSFKAHRGLAEALYEQDPAHANVAQVVAEIESSVAILAPLPDALNDARTYRQAGAFYLEQGDAAAGSNRSQPLPAGSVRAYERAVPMLLRALAIIDAAHGPGVDARRADVYRVLSAVYTRLNERDKAVEAAAQARALEPSSPAGYQQSAAALLAAERLDDAAVALMVGSMVTGDRALREELVDLYSQGLDPLGCAVVPTPNGPAINPACDTVRKHLCAATPQAIAIHQRAGRIDEARRLQESAARQFRCP